MPSDNIFHLLTATEARQKGIHQKIACPSCGHLTFVPYIADKGQTIIDNTECGRCDRESNCGYHQPPAEYFSKHPERRADFFDDTSCKHQQYKSYRPYPLANQQKRASMQSEPAKPIICLPDAAKPLVRQMMDVELKGTFMQYLARFVPSNLLVAAIKRYGIGHTRNGATIWWQIDEEARLRDGKIMSYLANGHRDKSVHPSWVHIMLERINDEQGYPLWNKDMPQTTKSLFGQHLLAVPKYGNRRVIVVESEKNAIIGHLIMPQYLWLATGSKGNFNPDMLRCLAGRDVWALPDADAFDEWAQKARAINEPKIQMWDMIEKLATPEMREKGTDIADLILAELESGIPFDDIVYAFSPKDCHQLETDKQTEEQRPQSPSIDAQEKETSISQKLLDIANDYPLAKELIESFHITDAEEIPYPECFFPRITGKTSSNVRDACNKT